MLERHELSLCVLKTTGLASSHRCRLSDEEPISNLFRELLKSHNSLGYYSSFLTPSHILRAMHTTRVRTGALYSVGRGQLLHAQSAAFLPFHECTALDTEMGPD